jgi:X-Pro dipeptidyl-peptidase
VRRLAPLVALLTFALPAAARADVYEKLAIQTSLPGVILNAEVDRPDGDAKVPIILTYSPYNTLGETNSPNTAADGVAGEFVSKGYARVVADVAGTRGSTGCWDYGGKSEQQSGVDLVNALAKLPWSNGKVAMIGGSYDGTTANMVAARGTDVPGLAAIVPESAISHWYGYAFQAGVRYFGNSDSPTDEGIDTPLGFDFGFGRTVGTDPMQPQYLQAATDRANECDAVSHTQHAYSRDPDYDDFWLQRDYIKDAKRFRVPTLIVHGWQDYNVKQSEGLDLYEAIPVDDPATADVEGVPFKALYMFQGTHQGPTGDVFGPLLDAFFAHTLKGVDNGVERGTLVYSEPRSVTTIGTFAAFPSWPPPTTGPLNFRLGRRSGAGALTDTTSDVSSDLLTDTSSSAEEVELQDPGLERGWLFYASAPLARDIHIAGSPLLHAIVSVDSTRAQLSPTLMDIAPDDSATTISRGHLNLHYRDGLAHQAPIVADQVMNATVRFAPQDQIVEKGHRIGLSVAGSNVIWALPDDPGTTFTVMYGDAKKAGSTLELPIIGAAPAEPLPIIKGGIPGIPPRGKALTVRLRRGKGHGRVIVSGRAPRSARLVIKLRRGSKTLVTRKLRSSRAGRYSVVLRVRGGGRVKATVTTTVAGKRLVARSRALTVRR